MGAGSFGAGVGGAGHDPVYVPAAANATSLPRAVKYDPSTKQFVQNADGTMADVHPVDQAMALLLTMEFGSSPSVPDQGSKFRKRVTRVDANKIPAIALDEVQRIIKPFVEAGDVRLIAVQTDISTPGRVLKAVTYVNLRVNPVNPLPDGLRTITP